MAPSPRPERRPPSRLELLAHAGVILLVTGACLLVAWSLVPVFTSPDVPGPVRVGTGMVLAGLVLILVRVVVDRIRRAGDDPYREVER